MDMQLGEKIATWARNEPSVCALVSIGSRTRGREGDLWKADAHSDWDFQVIASRPELFETKAWARDAGIAVEAYAVRRAAVGGVPKVAAIMDGAEIDLVIIPAALISHLRERVTVGEHLTSPELYRTLQDLAVVIRWGWRLVHGEAGWGEFYRKVLADIRDPRLSDAEAINLAEGSVCDAVWIMRKVDRGEYLAAQRMMHRSLAETNIRLLHELKLRRNQRTFPDARRAEMMFDAEELAQITVAAVPTRESLRAALRKSVLSCGDLMRELVGDAWRCPSRIIEQL